MTEDPATAYDRYFDEQVKAEAIENIDRSPEAVRRAVLALKKHVNQDLRDALIELALPVEVIHALSFLRAAIETELHKEYIRPPFKGYDLPF